jgi:CO/xanthine dehydrogenase FAD-binding subunit
MNFYTQDMKMDEIQWHFPASIAEIEELLKIPKTIPHGGGTAIIRSGMGRIRGLIDLSHLGLDRFSNKDGSVRFGATMTFSGVAEHVEALDRGNILSRALSRAASTPLRNRITVGGSAAHFPAWSDLIGPLIALDASVSLVGAHRGTFRVLEYVTSPELRKHTLITDFTCTIDAWRSFYYRETRTSFDYPAFTVTILVREENGRIEDMRVVIVGCTGKFKRLFKIEDALRGKRCSSVPVEGIGRDLDIRFTAKKFMSTDYLRHLAGVVLERGLEEVLGG